MGFPSPHRAVLLVLTLLLGCPGLSAAAPPGVSQEAWEESRAAFKRGVGLYKEGRYEEAEEAFREAHRLGAAPDLLFNLSRAAEKQGKCGAAAVYLERYLQARPGAPDRDQVQAKIDLLRKEEAEAPPPATPVRPMELPREAPAPPSSGPPVPGVPGAAPAAPTAAPLVPGKDDGPLLVQRRERRSLPPALRAPVGLTVGGGLLLLGGAGCGLSSYLLAREINSTPEGGRFSLSRYQLGQAFEIAAIVGFAAGGAALFAGTLWTALLAKRTRAPSPKLSAAPHHLGLLVSGEF